MSFFRRSIYVVTMSDCMGRTYILKLRLNTSGEFLCGWLRMVQAPYPASKR